MTGKDEEKPMKKHNIKLRKFLIMKLVMCALYW